MKIVIAPDKFKDCLDAAAVAVAIAAGVRAAAPAAALDRCPLSDGGEGFVDALIAATAGRRLLHRVTGPLPDMKVDAPFGILGDKQTAVVEMAAASGLHLLAPQERHPMRTTTFGTGELIAHAVAMGCRKILLGIGGSATVDGGIGCAQACGLPVLLDEGEVVSATEPLTGHDLERVMFIKRGRGSKVDGVEFTVACDVTNPLTGPTGAAAVYGPQKGATPQHVAALDRALDALARRTGTSAEAQTPGAGAAGGLGYCMLAFFNARLVRGIDLVLDAVALRHRLADADLCITGEGQLDAQSLQGKVPAGVAALCRELGVPCVALAGSIDRGVDGSAAGLSACFSICNAPMSLDDAMAGAGVLLARSAAEVTRLFLAGQGARPPRSDPPAGTAV